MSMKKRLNVKILILLLIFIASVPISNVGAIYNPDFILERDQYPYGGTFTLSRTSDWPTLNPFVTTGNAWSYTLMVYEGLVTTGADWNPAPWLAKDWDISADAKTYTFYLYENATWQDGVPLTSEDVLYTWNGWKEQELSRMAPYYENIEKIETPDPYTVIFYLNEGDSAFIPRILMWPAVCVIPKHIWENIEDWSTFDWGDPATSIGSGPFKFKEWKKGEYLILEAHEDYWMGRPYLDEIRVVIVGMRDIELLGFEKGEFDLFRGLQGNEVTRFLGKDEYRIYQVFDKGASGLHMNNRRAPGNDINWRRALSYAVDRDKIIELAYYGYGSSVRHYLTPTIYDTNGWVPPEDGINPYNLTMAAYWLDQGGYLDVDADGWREYPDGSEMKLTILESDYERYIRVAEVVLDSLQSIGVNVELEVLGGGAWTVRVQKTYDYDLSYFRYGPGSGDPREVLGYLTSWGANWYGFYNETYDAKYREAGAIVDYDELTPVIWELLEILAENIPFIPVPNAINLCVVNTEALGGWSNPEPYGPAIAQHWAYYNLHLPGDPAAVATSLAIQVSEEAQEGEPVTISTTLTDANGNPVEGTHIDFVIDDLFTGSVKTDADGKASFNWVPTVSGSVEVETSFVGNPQFESSMSSASTVTVAGEEPDEPTNGNGEEPTDGDGGTNMTLYLGIAVVVIIAAGLYYMQSKKT